MSGEQQHGSGGGGVAPAREQLEQLDLAKLEGSPGSDSGVEEETPKSKRTGAGGGAVKKSGPVVRQTKASQLRASNPKASPSGSSSGGSGGLNSTLRPPEGASPRTPKSPGGSTPGRRVTSPSPNKSNSNTPRVTAGGAKVDTKNVTSKIGSKANINHKPGGGNRVIETQKIDLTNVKSKIGSKDNVTHQPGGGRKKVFNDNLKWEAKSKVGSLENTGHTPRGGDKKIQTEALQWNTTSKVGSMENKTHKPGGGNIKIQNETLRWHTSSKVGSLDNWNHKPSGGDVKLHCKSSPGTQSSTPATGAKIVRAVQKPTGLNTRTHAVTEGKANQTMSRVSPAEKFDARQKQVSAGVQIHKEKVDFKQKAQPKVGSKDNVKHQPGGGKVKIVDEKLSFKEASQAKVGSLETCSHKPAGGDVLIFDEKLKFNEVADAKVGSLDNAQHMPGGGGVAIFDEKLHYEAKPRINAGAGGGSREAQEQLNQLNGNPQDLSEECSDTRALSTTATCYTSDVAAMSPDSTSDLNDEEKPSSEADAGTPSSAVCVTDL